MRCAECDCVSDAAGGWIAVLGRDPEDDDALTEVVAFCPVCATRVPHGGQDRRNVHVTLGTARA